MCAVEETLREETLSHMRYHDNVLLVWIRLRLCRENLQVIVCGVKNIR